MKASRTRARGLPRAWSRPVPGPWRRRSTLAAAGAVALLAGLGAGFATGLVPGSGDDALPDGPADACGVVQAAWSRSASLQVGMTVDDPESLRHGFVGARDALADVRPPDAVAADWRTVTSYVGTVADAVESADEDDVAAAVASAIATLDTDAMTQASDRITTFLKDDCGAGTADEGAG
ncbi:hypothetical protein [Isoptericola sp. NPDC055881]